MLNVTPETSGRAISVLCIRQHAAQAKMKCSLGLFISWFDFAGDGHHQKSRFQLVCSDLAGGLPDDPNHLYQMTVPGFVTGDDNDDGIRTSVRETSAHASKRLRIAPEYTDCTDQESSHRHEEDEEGDQREDERQAESDLGDGEEEERLGHEEDGDGGEEDNGGRVEEEEEERLGDDEDGAGEEIHGHEEDGSGSGEEEEEEIDTEPDDDGMEEEEIAGVVHGRVDEEMPAVDHGGDSVEAEIATADPPPPPPPRAAVAGVTVEDGDALDCGVCYNPLKPPIYQCEVGHVVCSPCHERMTPTPTCHVCRVPVTGGAYRRCHAMERLVSSIHVACPHAAHGCAAAPPYHDLESHLDTCPHAPNCHCPGDGCGFVGSTTALLAHFAAAAHGWPCVTHLRSGEDFALDDGLNFHLVKRHLIMINVTRLPLIGRAISVLCIHPHAAAADEMRCELRLFSVSRRGEDYHDQKAVFRMDHSDLANGLPAGENQRFQFVVPRHVNDDYDGAIHIRDYYESNNGTIGGGGEESHGHEEDGGGGEDEEETQGEPDDDDGVEGSESDRGDGLEERETAGVVDAREETPPADAPAAVAGVTVEDGDALDCGVCYHPLKPPIYPCEVGHVVCSPCHDRMTPTPTCHVCRVPVTGGAYRRCHAMERLVSSIHVACPHAAHSFAATPPYHDLESHLDTCPHAPNCHCPGDGCGFVGSTTVLLAHFAAAVHAWPCDTRTAAAAGDTYSLDDGFNFLRVEHHDAAGGGGGDRLVMLNMTREAYGRAISVLCIHPNAAAVAAAMRCEIRYESRVGYYYGGGDDGAPWHGHVQKSVFDVGHSDLAGGLPDPKQGFQFILPSCVMPDDGEGFIRIHVRMIVIN
uniref:RING-type E3 ubiquitin transferase n=1 Tax=Leersia perrieri TaxID=77586 RepID=A0A0D9WCY1_9ORYZ